MNQKKHNSIMNCCIYLLVLGMIYSPIMLIGSNISATITCNKSYGNTYYKGNINELPDEYAVKRYYSSEL